ncbi:MAG: glycosyltransferase [Bacteroidota bacterium]
MNVLIVTNMYPTKQSVHSGIFVKDQVRQLQKSGIQVTVLVIKQRGEPFISYLTALRKVRRTLNASHFDIVHFHYGLTGFSAFAVTGTPVVLTLHGSDVEIGWQRLISRLAAIKADAIVVQNEKHARLFMDKSHVIPCGIDSEIFFPVPRDVAREKLGLSREKKYILFPANPSNSVKNFQLFSKTIDALKLLDTKVEPLVLKNIERSQVNLFYNACDCCLVTSHYESGPLVVKEALYLDIPVFSVDVGDVRSVFGRLADTYIVSNDPNIIAQKIFHQLHSEEKIEFSNLVQHYTLDSVGNKLLDLYNHLLKK